MTTKAIIFWLGMVGATVLLWALIGIDERLNPKRDLRKSSWWLWGAAALMLAGGVYWMASNSSRPPFIANDEREWMRR
jgi:cytochrome c oxidase assembly factor CtaG